MLHARWFPMKYVKEQAALLTSKKRYKVVVAGRGSGKTELAKRYLVSQCCATVNGLFFYVAPTLKQARDIAWRDFIDLIPPEMVSNKWENVCIIRFKNGSELRLLSGEKPKRLEGVQWNGGVVDECSDQDLHKLFHMSLEPAMTHKKAWCWLIGVPKRWGIGAKQFRKFYDMGLQGHELFDSFHWKTAQIADPEELRLRKENLSPDDFREQYEASWENPSGLVCPDFGPLNIKKISYNPGLPIIVGSDFNINPMSWCLAQFDVANGTLNFFDELFVRNTTTTKTLDILYRLYGQHQAGWVFVGDATSRSRKTSAALTDYVHIESDARFKHKKMAYPKANPGIKDRIAVVNAAVCNTYGVRRVFFDPSSCPNCVSALTYMAYTDKGELQVTDDSHMFDAVGYTIMKYLPMKFPKVVSSVKILTG